jgi:RimJ/RimL family protein N-acetyltransferase
MLLKSTRRARKSHARYPDPMAPRPTRVTLAGRHIRIVPVDPRAHAPALYTGSHGPGHEDLWRYLFVGPFAGLGAFRAYLEERAASEDPLFFTLLDAGTSEPLGYASLLRIEPAHRVIEIGNILYLPSLQKTVAATEAMYLFARYVFEDLGYRRYEWKCHAFNEPSRRAALRLGFTFEGIFRQHMIVKGKNRDTAWYSMLDTEWPARKAAFEKWLSPDNFTPEGNQIEPLRR